MRIYPSSSCKLNWDVCRSMGGCVYVILLEFIFNEWNGMKKEKVQILKHMCRLYAAHVPSMGNGKFWNWKWQIYESRFTTPNEICAVYHRRFHWFSAVRLPCRLQFHRVIKNFRLSPHTYVFVCVLRFGTLLVAIIDVIFVFIPSNGCNIILLLYLQCG